MPAPTLDLGTLMLAVKCRHLEAGEEFSDWSPLEWAGAMAGEAGEAANIAKKITRQMKGSRFAKPGEPTIEELNKKLGKEMADTVIYLIIMALERSIDLTGAIVDVFNEGSDQRSPPFKTKIVPLFDGYSVYAGEPAPVEAPRPVRYATTPFKPPEGLDDEIPF